MLTVSNSLQRDTRCEPARAGGQVMYRDIPSELRELIEPVVADHGLELVDVTLHRGRSPWLLRVTVDTPAGDGRVSIDRCAEVSREIATQLDATDFSPGAYHLEVSSPGMDRVLAREIDFARACGSEVSVETRRPLDGRRRFRGTLLGFESDVATISVDGRAFQVPFAEVAKANSIYRFSSADFGGKGSRGAREGAPRED
jgi:ribosome maturation factor RimP